MKEEKAKITIFGLHTKNKTFQSNCLSFKILHQYFFSPPKPLKRNSENVPVVLLQRELY